MGICSGFRREEAFMNDTDFDGRSISPNIWLLLLALSPETLVLRCDGGTCFAFVLYLDVGDGESASEDASGSSAPTCDDESKELVSDSSETIFLLLAPLPRTPGLDVGKASLESEDLETLVRAGCCPLRPAFSFVKSTEFWT
jgi:hypothetical protein